MSERTVYIVAYDICDAKRLRMIYKTMRGYGEHWQYSVFRCELTPAEKVKMMTDLGRIMNDAEDQVLIAPASADLRRLRRPDFLAVSLPALRFSSAAA